VGQKILVVEDNELNLKLFCDLLRAHGYEAEPVRDGREAVERARRLRARPHHHGHPDAAHQRPGADRAAEGDEELKARSRSWR
jgi:CheY-like chemotaxis protein